MKLDSRIKALSDVLTCFDTERAEQFIGQKGYFADFLSLYNCLADSEYDVLTELDDDEQPFKGSSVHWWYFLPESSLKPIEKKYRPYTFQEFWGDFAAGHPVKFRKKDEEGDELYLILNGYSRKQYRDVTVRYINLGGLLFTLEELFAGYEWYDDAAGDWRPFGVELEE